MSDQESRVRAPIDAAAVSKQPLTNLPKRLPDGILRFVQSADGKSRWAEFADGSRLPVRYRRRRDGSGAIALDTAAIRKNEENRNTFLRELGKERLHQERALRKRREAIIQYVCTHAPCLMKAQLPVTTLPISPAIEMHLRYKEALTNGERIVAGLAGVQRADEWEEVEPGRRVAYMRFVPDPRKEPRVNKVAMVCEFLKSQEGAAILKRRRPFKEMRTAFDCWRFRVDKRTLEKRRERRGLCYSRFLIDGSPMYTFLINPSTQQVIDPQFCFPDLIVEYPHPA